MDQNVNNHHQLAVSMLSEGRLAEAFVELKQATSLPTKSLQSQVQNKLLFGEYYKLKNRPLIALRCFQQGLHLQLSDPLISLKEVAETKIHICVVLNMLDKHSLAKDFVKGAIQNLMEDQEQDERKKVLLDQAYFNLGVELEHLREFDAAQEAFSKSQLGVPVLPSIKQKAETQREEHLKRVHVREAGSLFKYNPRAVYWAREQEASISSGQNSQLVYYSYTRSRSPRAIQRLKPNTATVTSRERSSLSSQIKTRLEKLNNAKNLLETHHQQRDGRTKTQYKSMFDKNAFILYESQQFSTSIMPASSRWNDNQATTPQLGSRLGMESPKIRKPLFEQKGIASFEDLQKMHNIDRYSDFYLSRQSKQDIRKSLLFFGGSETRSTKQTKKINILNEDSFMADKSAIQDEAFLKPPRKSFVN